MKITSKLSIVMICLFTVSSFSSFAGGKKGFEMDKSSKTTLESAAESAATTTTLTVTDLKYSSISNDCKTSGTNCTKIIIKVESSAIMSGGILTGVELGVNATLRVDGIEDPIAYNPSGTFEPRHLALGAIEFEPNELESFPEGVTLTFDTYYMTSPNMIVCSGPTVVQ